MIFLNQIERNIRKATSSSYESVRCAITLLDGVGAVVAHIADVYSRVIDGYHEFPGVEELVRAYMLQNNLTVIVPSVTHYYYINGESATPPTTQNLGILYHGSKLRIPVYRTADEVVEGWFLVPYKSVYVMGGTYFHLPYYASAAGTATITRTYADGTTDTSTAATSAGLTNLVIQKGTCIHAHVEFGYRTMDIYFVEADKREHFSFRNVFNVLEHIDIPASFESNPKTEFETAQQDKVLQRYDIEYQLEMSVKTGALPAGMYKQLLALCQARSVTYYQSESLPITVSGTHAISIEEYKLPKSTEPNTPLTFEMKFKYCDTEMNDAVVLS